jgi:hypothetical protein
LKVVGWQVNFIFANQMTNYSGLEISSNSGMHFQHLLEPVTAHMFRKSITADVEQFTITILGRKEVNS